MEKTDYHKSFENYIYALNMYYDKGFLTGAYIRNYIHNIFPVAIPYRISSSDNITVQEVITYACNKLIVKAQKG